MTPRYSLVKWQQYFGRNMSSTGSAAMNQANQAAGYTEGKGSYKICMANEGLCWTVGNAGPEGAATPTPEAEQ
jgi:hypothetical protein